MLLIGNLLVLMPSALAVVLRILTISSFVSGSRTSTRERDRSGLITSKLGFSVVAPIKIIVPSSTWGKNASCWALLKRWISSTKRMVCIPSRRFWAALSITLTTSAFPEVTALSSTNSAPVPLAIILARVVLPLPGGPQSIRLVGCLLVMISWIILPVATKWAWPTTSSSFSGLRLSASGLLSIP